MQGYQERNWADLVQLWKALNDHIAHVMESAGTETVTSKGPLKSRRWPGSP